MPRAGRLAAGGLIADNGARVEMVKRIADKLVEAEAFLVTALRRANYFGRRRLAPGVRSLAGLACMVGGAFGFLPVLGYWMIPVGVLLVALDVPRLRPVLRRRLAAWSRRAAARRRVGDGPP